MTERLRPGGGSGLPHWLAAERSQRIASVAYALSLRVPAAAEAGLDGHVAIAVELTAGAWPPIDFAPGTGVGGVGAAGAPASIRALSVDGKPAPFEIRDGRIELQGAPAAAGPHRIDIDFVAGGAGLTRREGLIYTLFVPARAHTVFPCFDQPDLKGPLTLTLDLPAGWDALANAPETARTVAAARLELRFAASEPLPTYLYAFAAGRLRRELHESGGRRIVLLCPPAAATALGQHRAAILELKTRALDLLEDYTGLAHPFAQTGLVLIPDFEFAGMEHPGAIFYRQDALLLAADAGLAAAMRRAALIAHETAHLWFGDLVTIRWFDDVWLKEVCANFMADRFLARHFPNTDHATAFLLRHYPAAWAIDRSEGTHPIRRPLANLGEAAELYDALIYHKAPIAFAELEREIGAAAMQAGLRRWLGDFRFASADWPALRARLEQAAGRDLGEFDRRWIETAGRQGRVSAFDPAAQLPYAGFTLGQGARAGALDELAGSPLPRVRAAAWLALYEDMLDGGITPAALLTAALSRLGSETDALLNARLLADLGEIYWRFLPAARRAFAAGPAERVLLLRAGPGPDRYWLRALARFAQSEQTLAMIETVWRRDLTGAGAAAALDQSPGHELALMLALRRPERAADIVAEALRQTRDAGARHRLEFLAPALSPDRGERDRLFDRLLAGQGRDRRAVAALGLLCHPLRADTARDYLPAGIGHARALHAQGDVFLPRQWLDALFGGQRSVEAAAAIRQATGQAGLAPGFRALLLQAADPVFRAARLGSAG